jgi:hypothetical protein
MERAHVLARGIPRCRIAPGTVRGALELCGHQFVVLSPAPDKTYARWARSTPEAFRFSVKLPKPISHAGALQFAPEGLDRFIGEALGLGPKLGVLLVQFPPRLPFDEAAAGVNIRDHNCSWCVGLNRCSVTTSRERLPVLSIGTEVWRIKEWASCWTD